MGRLILLAPDGHWYFAHGRDFPAEDDGNRIPLWSRFRYDLTGEIYEWNGTAWVLDGGGGGGGAPDPHATTHQDGGTDEVNVTGLSGLLADAQTPLAHTHVKANITDFAHTHPQADVTDLEADLATLADAIADHAAAADPHPTYATDADLAAHVGAADPHPLYALDTDLTAHVGAADPHTGYQKESEKAAASGYASLDASTLVPVAQIPSHDIITKHSGFPGGTANFLRADGTFAAPPAGAGGSASFVSIAKWGP